MIVDREIVREWLEVFAGSLAFIALLAFGYAVVAFLSFMMGNAP